MDEEYPGPSPCHLEYCDHEVDIACPLCEELVCYIHNEREDHGCKGRQLQIVEEKVNAVNMFTIYLFIRFLQEARINPSELQDTIAAFFSPETLSRLFSDRKWFVYITLKKLWKRFCHFPELYWKEPEINRDILERQYFSPCSLWKYNYDCETLLKNNWEAGIAEVKQLNLSPKKTIKLIKDYIDSFGKHWLFLMDGVTLDVWEIRSNHRFHSSIIVISHDNKNNVSKTKIVLSNEKLFIIWGNFIQVFAFSNPDYNLRYLYSFVCDESIKIANDYYDKYVDTMLNRPRIRSVCDKSIKIQYSFYEKILDMLNGPKIRNFHVHVLENVIIGHEELISTGIINIHIWDQNTGNKIMVYDFPLPNNTEISDASIKSQVYPLEQCIIFNASIYLNGKPEMTYLIVENIKAFREQALFWHNPASLSLAVSNSESSVGTYIFTLPKSIIFCNTMSKDKIIACSRQNRQLEFQIFGMKGGQRNDIYRFDVPLSKKLRDPSVKIHLFKELTEGNEILCVAIENCRIQVIDLRVTILQKSPKTKMLCKIKDTNKVYFVDPKFVLVLFDKKDIGEIWDAEKGHIITSPQVSDKYVRDLKATWHNLIVVPPPKLITFNEQQVYILDFEKTYRTG